MSAVLGLWLDRPPLEALETAVVADELGYRELWIGEMASFDAFALATAVGQRMSRARLVVGPLAVAVRTPVAIALGAASVAALTGRPVDVAIGSSSRAVVEGWHGRDAAHAGAVLAESAAALRPLLAGERGTAVGDHVRTRGFRLRLDPPGSSLTVAAFGPRAVEAAARYADRMVVNLVTPATTRVLVDRLAVCAAAQGRPRPRVAAWVPVAVDPAPEAFVQLARALVPYLAARGYDEMFRAAGFGAVVDAARPAARPADIAAAVPGELVRSVSMVGSLDQVRRRAREYVEAGVDEVCAVPVTAGDPAGRRTLAALATLAAPPSSSTPVRGSEAPRAG